MTELSQWFSRQPVWIVLDINPELPVFPRMHALLSNELNAFSSFKSKLSSSITLGPLTVETQQQEAQLAANVDKMLAEFTKKGWSVLITVDEVTATKQIRELCAEFQIWVRKGYRIVLLMAGLYENIDELINKNSLTFLYRAASVELAPLDGLQMSRQYQNLLGMEEKEAVEMARMTKGYPYAYQIMGYVAFNHKNDSGLRYEAFDRTMRERAYEKIWSELSETDRSVLLSMVSLDSCAVTEIRENLGMDPNNFHTYRNRLIRKGVPVSKGHGLLEFALLRFREFILYLHDFD